MDPKPSLSRPAFGPRLKAFSASLPTFPLCHHNLPPPPTNLQRCVISASLEFCRIGTVLIRILEVRLAAEPSAAPLRVTILGRKGLRHQQPFVEQHLLSSTGVTEVNIPTLPPRRSHSTRGTEHLEFQVSHSLGNFGFWPCSNRYLYFNKQLLCARPSTQRSISLTLVHSSHLP